MIKPAFDIQVRTSSEFCDESGTEINFDVEVDSEDADILFKYYPFNPGNIFLNTDGEMLEPNIFHSIDRLGDSSYCESGDECSVGFYMSCPKTLNIGGKFLFTFKNELEETVALILDISKDHAIKTEFVNPSAIS